MNFRRTGPEYDMTVNGLTALINMPDAPEGEGKHGLPPYEGVKVMNVDDYHCPEDWMHGSSLASSYFMQVTPGKHLWIDLNSAWSHTHHVAAVVSVQGINPITGPTPKGFEDTPALELRQYRDKCWFHKEPFESERYCPKCKFKHPAQNYMTTTSHERGKFWLDGWRTKDGSVDGFLITAETMRGIAAQTIKEKRVFAVGIAFFLSKEPKPVSRTTFLRAAGVGGSSTGSVISAQSMSMGQGMKGMASSGGVSSEKFMMGDGLEPQYTTHSTAKGGDGIVPRGRNMFADESEGIMAASLSPETPVDVKLEIAAGAEIEQKLCYDDPSDPDFYQDEPVGMLYLNYVGSGDYERIMAAGKKDREAEGKGPLKGLQTGNPVS